MSSKVSLNDFFKDKTLLLTGSTGFLGKCLLHRILSQCPRVHRVFLLLRSKSGQSSAKRLKELFNQEIFRTIDSKQLAKVLAITGDVTQHQLGMSTADRLHVQNTCHVIMNCAATIRFDEPLKRALQLNVLSVRRVLQLARACTHLDALVHVSTAYCTRDPNDVREEVDSEEEVNYCRLLEALDWMSDSLLDAIEKHVLSRHVSTYHVSKQMAEQLLLAEGDSAPIAIVRPSIVVGALKDPFPGWTDHNYNGISGFLVASGKGVLRTLHCNPRLLCDVIPVDLVANTCIVAARAVASQSRGRPLVVNCVSGPINGITWHELTNTCLPFLRAFPSKQVMRVPHVSMHAHKWAHVLHALIAHRIPAFVVDLMFRAFQLEPILSQVYQKVNRSLEALEPFTCSEWKFQCKQQMALFDELLDSKEREEFVCDVRALEWKEFFKNYVKSIRKHVLKEEEQTVDESRRRLNRLNLISTLTQFSIFGFLLLLVLKRRSLNLRNSLIDL